MMWAYRDPDLCCGDGGANDGLFQVELGSDDPENLPLPSTTSKVIGGWVQKTDATIWGRVITADGNINLPQGFAYLEDEVWTHLAFRGNGEEYEVIIAGQSGEGPLIDYDGSTLLENDTIYIGRQGTETWGGRLDDFRVYSQALSDEEIQEIMTDGGGGGEPGDFNNDGVLDASDIDLLTAVVIAASNDLAFDLDKNNLVDQEDRRVWVQDLRKTYYGDADLNGEFNSSDLVAVLSAGTYEADVDAQWGSGDFDGDGRSTSSDLVAALADGGYEVGPRLAVSAVPEPSQRTHADVGLPAALPSP